MARNKKKGSILLGMVLYALIFLAITAGGLRVLWDYMDSYETSRPKNTIDQYVQQLTVGQMMPTWEQWKEVVDPALQSEEQIRQVVEESLNGKITYARKSSVSTETSQTYVLRCGSQVIGEAVIKADMPGKFGFTLWTVAEEEFDFSYLLCKDQSVTVPDSYSVAANGVVLNESYITEKGMEYVALEEFYDDYENLPMMVTYTAGGILGDLQLQVLDETGAAVENWDPVNCDVVLDNCSQEEWGVVRNFMENFLFSYVEFSGGSNQAETRNYRNLVNNYLIEGSDLANRLYTALDGLAFSQSYGDVLDEVTIHGITRIDDDRIFCDATYMVSTYGKAGRVQTTNNIKVILVTTQQGLRVEAMTRY